jgi:hypothetical protein
VKKICLSVLLAVAASFPVHAAGLGAVRKTVEATMQVRGQVVIAPDGTLQSYTLEKPEALPDEVESLLARYLPACEFSVATASGKPGTVTSNMSLQILARQNEQGGMTISVNGSAARRVQVGDIIIIAAFASVDERELDRFDPRLVYVDESNRITRIGSGIAIQ